MQSFISRAAIISLAISCQGKDSNSSKNDSTLAQSIGDHLTALCPSRGAADQEAWQLCRDKLTTSKLLDENQSSEFLWGQQHGTEFNLNRLEVTRFNPLVWRRMYLSMFMFSGPGQIENTDDDKTTLVYIPAQFRNELNSDLYPYPFWHSQHKWQAYQETTGLVFVIESGEIAGAMRSSTMDPARPKVTHDWDGQWSSDTSVFGDLFSDDNPHLEDLELAFTELEREMRPYNCVGCHAPDNVSEMAKLDILVYPNQSLGARALIVDELEQNSMPPAANGQPPGIADPAAREKVIAVAKEFKELGDLALEFERR